MSDADQYFDNWTRTIIERDAWKKRALEAESSKGTIHVAPCSCELHVRIRELEAELAAQPIVEHRGYWKARSEKAEMNLSLTELRLEELNARHGECQARVAELERYKELTEQAERLEREAD